MKITRSRVLAVQPIPGRGQLEMRFDRIGGIGSAANTREQKNENVFG